MKLRHVPHTLAVLALAGGLAACSSPTPAPEIPRPDTTSEAPSSDATQPTNVVECPPTPLDVQIDFTLRRDTAGGVIIEVTTNLPDTADLGASLYADSGAYFAQDGRTVQGGAARFGPFSDKGTPLHGTYEVSITLPIARNQPEAVQACLGEAGELMTGALVSKEEITGDFVASRDAIVEIQ